MKKAFVVLSVIFVIATSLSSCCKKCSGLFGLQIEVCRNQYSSDVEYNNAVTALEIAGYTCQ